MYARVRSLSLSSERLRMKMMRRTFVKSEFLKFKLADLQKSREFSA